MAGWLSKKIVVHDLPNEATAFQEQCCSSWLSRGNPSPDQGFGRFGLLSLPSLEKLAETWVQELDTHWIEAKRDVSQRSAEQREIPDYLGIDATYLYFRVAAIQHTRRGPIADGRVDGSCGEGFTACGHTDCIELVEAFKALPPSISLVPQG